MHSRSKCHDKYFFHQNQCDINRISLQLNFVHIWLDCDRKKWLSRMLGDYDGMLGQNGLFCTMKMAISRLRSGFFLSPHFLSAHRGSNTCRNRFATICTWKSWSIMSTQNPLLLILGNFSPNIDVQKWVSQNANSSNRNNRNLFKHTFAMMYQKCRRFASRTTRLSCTAARFCLR